MEAVEEGRFPERVMMTVHPSGGMTSRGRG